MMDIRSVEERYKSDPVFAAIVDTLYSMLNKQESPTFTPTEMREAAMLAQMMYESTHIRPIMVDREFWGRR